MQELSVITGGAGGMGRATAKLIGRERLVLLADLKEEPLRAAAAELAQLGIRSETAVCDITERESVVALASRARSLGHVRSVVHTAGLSPQMASAEAIMKVNALGTIHVADAFYELADEGFCVVNVASMAGHMTPGFLVPRWSYDYASTDAARFFAWMMRVCNLVPAKRGSQLAYTLSKHFTIWYSRSQSKRFGARGARILSVSPGSFDTTMGRLEEDHGAGAILEHAALRRFGRVEEIAAVLAFCASAQAGYLTGTDILCDGGVIANIRPRDMMKLAR